MPKDYKKLLESAGFLPSEVKVYLACLEHGGLTVQEIARKANISRTAVYDAIGGLEDRGLISTIKSGKKNLFSAENPERIVSYLKIQQEEFKNTLNDIKSTIPLLKQLAGESNLNVRVLEGNEGIRAYYDHVSQVNPKHLDEISNLDDVYEFLDEKVLKAARNAFTTKTKVRLLYHGELQDPKSSTTFKKLSTDIGLFHGDIAIYNNFIAFLTYRGKISVTIIENDTLASSMKMIFNLLWQNSSEE